MSPNPVSAADYAIINGKLEGILIEYEIPGFMYVKGQNHKEILEINHSIEGQIPRKQLRDDQTPFISRIAIFNGGPLEIMAIALGDKTLENHIQQWVIP